MVICNLQFKTDPTLADLRFSNCKLQITNYKFVPTFHNRIVPIAYEARAHGLGILQFGVGSDLNVIELVGGSIVSTEGRILLLLHSLNQRFGVFLPADGGDLHIVTAARCRGGSGVGGGPWRRLPG